MKPPFSQACENNKQPILQQLKVYFADATHVLEIGSGSAQHAVFFAQNLPHLTWHTSDQIKYLEGIHAQLNAHPTANLQAPIEFKVTEHPWPCQQADAVFTANTTHIMQTHEAQAMMKAVSQQLPTDGIFCQYGPFNVDGKYTSESNQAFDERIRARGDGGIKDIAQLEAWAQPLNLIKVIDMPANNKILVWQKS